MRFGYRLTPQIGGSEVFQSLTANSSEATSSARGSSGYRLSLQKQDGISFSAVFEGEISGANESLARLSTLCDERSEELEPSEQSLDVVEIQ